MDVDRDDGFLTRWARRKQQVRSGVAVPAEALRPVVPAAQTPAALAPPAPVIEPLPCELQPATPALPTLQDVAALTRESDYARFVAPGVSSDVRNAAVKKLFTDPHYNLMDGLDTYIDDYGKPDPLPLSMLRQMNQSKVLGLFDHEAAPPAASDTVAALPPPTSAAEPLLKPIPEPIPEPFPEPNFDDHPDLQLQPDDAARRSGADPGAVA